MSVGDRIDGHSPYHAAQYGVGNGRPPSVREVFVKDIFCALLANSEWSTPDGYASKGPACLMERAESMADALIARLRGDSP